MILERMHIIAALLIFVCFFTVSVTKVADGASAWVVTDQSKVRIISEFDGVKGKKHLHLGLQVKLQPGWKIYWRSPGDAGIPPQLDWKGSENLQEAEMSWPIPERFNLYGLETWGYHDEVVYPIKVTLKDAEKPLKLSLHLFYGICENVCIPYQHDFTLDLSEKTAQSTIDSSLIESFLNRVPVKTADENNQIGIARTMRVSRQEFTIDAQTKTLFANPVIIIEEERGNFFKASSPDISADGKMVRFSVRADYAKGTDDISDVPLRITVIDGDMGIERQIVVPSN